MLVSWLREFPGQALLWQESDLFWGRCGESAFRRCESRGAVLWFPELQRSVGGQPTPQHCVPMVEAGAWQEGTFHSTGTAGVRCPHGGPSPRIARMRARPSGNRTSLSLSGRCQRPEHLRVETQLPLWKRSTVLAPELPRVR